jgi:hypothetical protein
MPIFARITYGDLFVNTDDGFPHRLLFFSLLGFELSILFCVLVVIWLVRRELP